MTLFKMGALGALSKKERAGPAGQDRLLESAFSCGFLIAQLLWFSFLAS